jgi:hypothetical protein
MTTNSNPELCPQCLTRKAGKYPNGLCRKCYDAGKLEMPVDLPEKVRTAQVSGDWRGLADSLMPVIVGSADGSIKVTAAQASLLKHITDRAYGKVTKTQEDKSEAAGVVILPMMGQDANAFVCEKCKEAHLKHA